MLLMLLAPTVLSHVPLGGGDNRSLATAIAIPDVGKSYTVFSSLNGAGEGRYYRFDARAGQRVLIVLQVSVDAGRAGLEPHLALMGPSLVTNASLPSYIEVPEGAGVVRVDGALPERIYYEGFSPAVFYRVAVLDIIAPSNGTYYFVVYSTGVGGNFNFAVGYREEFTLSEWLTVPLNQLEIYQWEGQPLYLAVLPMALVVAVALPASLWRLKNTGSGLNPYMVASLLAGLLFLGSSAMAFYQMLYCISYAGLVPELIITVIFAVIPMVLGAFVLRLSFSSKKRVRGKDRVLVAAVGVVALFFWAGLYLGPALAILSSVLPGPEKSG